MHVNLAEPKSSLNNHTTLCTFITLIKWQRRIQVILSSSLPHFQDPVRLSNFHWTPFYRACAARREHALVDGNDRHLPTIPVQVLCITHYTIPFICPPLAVPQTGVLSSALFSTMYFTHKPLVPTTQDITHSHTHEKYMGASVGGGPTRRWRPGSCDADPHRASPKSSGKHLTATQP